MSAWKGGVPAPSTDQRRSRFGSKAIDGTRIVDLKETNEALAVGRTVFPSTVVEAWASPRLLVSGHNNPKLGARVEKGRWRGMPLFHLTLEERATCPRSCALWAGCYGNAMHMARRHSHKGQFLDFLRAELVAKAQQYPDGFVVRLHTLGDFYSTEYVDFWRARIESIPPLRVFGYTAYRAEASDPRERAIGTAIEHLARDHWDRCAIRTSNVGGHRGTLVVTDVLQAGEALMCPAQHTETTQAKTAGCSTCGLCWESERPIAFLKHGRKLRRKEIIL